MHGVSKFWPRQLDCVRFSFLPHSLFSKGPRPSSSSMSFLDELRKIPPVTRFLCGSTLAVSVPVMLQIVTPYSIVFVPELVTRGSEASTCLSGLLCNQTHIVTCIFSEPVLATLHLFLLRWWVTVRLVNKQSNSCDQVLESTSCLISSWSSTCIFSTAICSSSWRNCQCSRNSNTLESTQFAGKSADYAWQLLLSTIGILVRQLFHCILIWWINLPFLGPESTTAFTPTFPAASALTCLSLFKAFT